MAFDFTIRRKLFAAFALLATVGGAGGVIALVRLQQLVAVYQSEQEEVAVHEKVHDYRLALFEINNLAHSYAMLRTPKLQLAFEERFEWMKNSGYCVGCHVEHKKLVGIPDLLRVLKAESHQLFNDDPEVQVELIAAALRRFVTSASELQNDLAHMERLYHDRLDHLRTRGKDILRPRIRELLLIVLGGLVIAILLAYPLSRAMSKPLLPLLEAARRIGSGDHSRPVSAPRDPELAQVAAALNEITAEVATRAKVDLRRQLYSRAIASQEEERKRLARELHDELGQSLSALLIEVRSRQTEDGKETGPRPALEKTLSLIDEVRRMAWNLRPSILDDYGLESALTRYAEEMSKVHGLSIDFQSAGFVTGKDRLESEIAIVLYRVAQESINNVTRHAKASHTSVVLVRREGEVTLVVEDDGIGFTPSSAQIHTASLGLLGMEERVSLVGGTLTIESAPGQGTTVQARVPLLGDEE